MNQLTLIIFFGLGLVYLVQVWRNRAKPMTTFQFYFQLIGAIALINLAWLGGGDGRMEYKIGLTIVALISIFQSILSGKYAAATN